MSGLRPVSDTDTVTFTLDGDELVLRKMPRQREVEASDEVEQRVAFKAMAAIKDAGIDTDKIAAEASTEDVDEAKKAKPAAKVREYRLSALAVRLVVDGNTIGGAEVVTTYQNMPPSAAAWVDERVAEVWEAAVPDDASARGESPDAFVPESAAYGTT